MIVPLVLKFPGVGYYNLTLAGAVKYDFSLAPSVVNNFVRDLVWAEYQGRHRRESASRSLLSS